MNILAVIPARGGSRGIPRKSIVPLAGRPLLEYTCAAARASTRLTRTILSTDDAEIAAVGRACGVEVPFLRPAALARDDTPMVDVLRDAAGRLAAHERYAPDALVLLQPTSPLRRACHIDACVDLLVASGADTVVSVVEVPHHFNPVSLMRCEGERLVPFTAGAAILRRQDKPRVLARNGPAVLAIRPGVLASGGFYDGDCRGYVMAREESVDVDDPFDLELAAFLLGRRHETARVS